MLIYDGDCAFCAASVTLIQQRIRPDCDVTPWQFANLGSYGITQRRANYEVLWVTPVGTVHGGAQAIAKLLLNAGKGWTVPGVLLTLPPMRWLAHGVYRLIANNRAALPGGTAACALPPTRSQDEVDNDRL
ncbi:DUF393 domain-containing protein [Actinacidiphila glaucinigra]|uniref:thiol-disulfide oxidoreductase DCC family protein n=1 Tax=Actinacidiphila glaucinigra TaxID=235986 RepID=UPI00386CD616